MARRTKEQSEATAREITEVARVLFASRGYAGVGLDEIAAGAGVTRGAVYHHFASKKGVFRAVHADCQARVAAATAQAVQGVADPWEALEAGCRAFLRAAVGDDVRRILLLEAPAVLGWTEWREEDERNAGRLLAEGLTELREAGLLPADRSTAAYRALLSGAMNEAALWAASGDDPEHRVDEAWLTLHHLLRGLRS